MIAPFELVRPRTVAEAMDAVSRDDAHVMAGGTALILLMKQGLIRPARVVSIGGIRELGGIERRMDGSLRIGALVTHAEAERSPLVRAHCAALAKAFGHVATPRIREQATVGGNLVHADPAQDPPPMLMALDAYAVLVSRSGERTVPLDELFVDVFETSVRPGELVREVIVPPLATGTRSAYAKFLPRTEDDYATVAVAVSVRTDGDGRCADIRVCVGAAGPTPLRATRTESALRGQRLTPDVVRDAARIARDETDPIADLRGSIAYKREMAAVWTERALLAAIAP